MRLPLHAIGLSAALLTLFTTAHAAADEPQIEYEVYLVNLRRTEPWDLNEFKRVDLPAAIETWRNSSQLVRLTKSRLTATAGTMAAAELEADRSMVVERGRFGGGLREHQKLVPAVERATTRLAITGRVVNDAIVCDYDFSESVELIPGRGAAILPGETEPSIWKTPAGGMSAKSNYAPKDDRPHFLGGFVTSKQESPEHPKHSTAELMFMSARIRR